MIWMHFHEGRPKEQRNQTMYGIMLDASHSKIPAKHTFIPYYTKVHHQKSKKPSYGTMLDASCPNLFQNTFYYNLLDQGLKKKDNLIQEVISI